MLFHFFRIKIVFLLVRLFGYAPFFEVGSSLHCSKLKKYSCIILQILHINNYLILPEAKVEKMESCIFSEKVVIEN